MKSFRNPARQRGAALMVCLIILILVTLMGLTSLRTSMLQEKCPALTPTAAWRCRRPN